MRQQPTVLQSSANASSHTQHNAPVGSSQRHIRQIVSIRAGQGPADDVPPPHTKTPFAPGQGRTRDAGSTSIQGQLSSQPGQLFLDPALQPQQRGLNHRVSQGSMHRGHSTGPAPYSANTSQANVQPYGQGAQGNSGYHPPAHKDTSLGVEGMYAAYTASAPAAVATVTPPSMTVPTPNPNAHSRPSPARAPPDLPPKPSYGTPPMKAADSQIPDNFNAPGHHARLSVYHPLQHKASAELFVHNTQQPQTQSVTVNTTSVKDLAARFPLNEDVLTSAASSTLNGGTDRSDQGTAAAAQHAQGRYSAQRDPARDPPPQIWHPTESQNASATHKRSGHPENDVPVPIPYPKSGFMPATAVPPAAAARPQAIPLQAKPSTAPPQGYLPSHAAVPYPTHSSSRTAPMQVL